LPLASLVVAAVSGWFSPGEPLIADNIVVYPARPGTCIVQVNQITISPPAPRRTRLPAVDVNDGAIDLTELGLAAHGHRTSEFGLQHLEHGAHTVAAVSGESPHNGASDQNRLCA
jgi:hypothetical protein